MISGIRTRLAASLLTFATGTAGATEADVVALLERLARPAPDSTPFVEVRFSALLTEPLMVAGELEHRDDGALVRRVLEPYRETTTLLGEDVTVERDGSRTRRFSLDRAPELRGILNGFGAMLKGDRATLERHFEIVADAAGDVWRIDLVPRADRLRARLAGIRVDGAEDRPSCLTMEEADGDATVMVLGVTDLDFLPSPVERERLESWCIRVETG